jgi:hypothetical protein
MTAEKKEAIDLIKIVRTEMRYYYSDFSKSHLYKSNLMIDINRLSRAIRILEDNDEKENNNNELRSVEVGEES